MTNGLEIPKLLEHVNLERWRRPGVLVRLVAALYDGIRPVPIWPGDLEALGRTSDQARWDHAVLIRLATVDRVLIRYRGGGGYPDCWGIRQPGRSTWLHVPWITPKARAIADAFGLESRISGPATRVSAGRTGGSTRVGPLFEVIQAWAASANDYTRPRHDRARQRQDAGQTPLETRVAAPIPGAPLNSLLLKTSSSYEDEEAKQPSREAKALIRVVEELTKKPVYGATESALAALANTHAGRIDDLVSLARDRLAGVQWPPTAASKLASLVSDGELGRRPGPSDPSRRLEVVRRLLTADPDNEDLLEELERLESGLSDPGAI